MSGLRLRETFNGLLTNQFTQFLKKGSAAVLLSASLILPGLPAHAHHDDNDDLNALNSQTEHSQELRSIQDEFNRAVRDRRIILVDHDWLELNRALNDIGDDEEMRNRYLAEYLEEYGYLHIPHDYFSRTSDAEIHSPHSQRMTLTTDTGQQLEVCLVFGAEGLQDPENEIREFIDVSRVIHGNDFYDAEIRNIPDSDEFKRFVNYHEIGHCMDDFYMTQMAQATDGNDYLASYHRTESFADVFGVLMMARDAGVTDIAEQIANTRLANMALGGPIQVGWGNPQSVSFYGSYIYATHRSVRAAQDFIDQNGAAALQAMTQQEVAALAADIVRDNALSQPEADALLYLFSAQHDMTSWALLRSQVPFVDERYPLAEELRREMSDALRAIMDLDHIPAGDNVLDHLSFSGTPGQYINELRTRANQTAIDQYAVTLGDQLVRQAGPQADIAALVTVFTAQKDSWRHDLDSADELTRRQAEENLAAASQALWRAAQIIRGLDPDIAPNANDNAPDVAPAAAPSQNMAP